jgi:DNA-binding response OmpR family regulator
MDNNITKNLFDEYLKKDVKITMSKILLVDHDPEITKNIDNLLSDIGYEVIIAKDSSDAISLTNQILPDIVLLDATYIQENVSKICENLKDRTQKQQRTG